MRHGKYGFIVGFLALPLAIYAVFVISPFVQAIYYSFTNWSGLSSDLQMVGFDNYRKLLDDDVFWHALRNNLVLLLVLPLVTLGMGLFFAFMLNVGGRRKGAVVSGVRGSSLYKVVYFFPQVLSIAIVALIFQFAYNPNSGALNSFLSGIGLDSVQPNWLGDPSLALWCVMAVMVWSNVGFYVVLFSAAMSTIPRDFYEAALLDGANRFTTFFRITLPLLWDTVQTGWVYMGILALDAFAVVQIMTVGPGGPDYSTEVLTWFVYTKGIRDGQAGYATALGVALLIVTMIFAAIVMRLGRRERLEF
ncbi:carbohydrate ABC transporter permease [Streptomyces buecherae]|uniref:carbohydrate ABC transporter permease n=4 Tax=Streptomyces buecherae TaxID=2763006 RepID=UPI00164D2814|nr:sugar ABC transporter permease [Streptomyces buecherae]MBC3985009.1 sugar ABC transporter permease [Streptomyces buecherae]MBC3985109.1 sugar ABC transporter permease [Streptomyces buecherae]MBC3992540.1 sugar ABC transporter permease [Streptomyces buecherae]QNJ39583.1 sugar ABC transporter permease [Streptomyces buecherae]QNJ43807.1 sugar ABC transporter permease [Streptomyces buecherae]